MIAHNDDGTIRGVSYLYPTGVGDQQWSPPGPVFKSDDDPGGPKSYDGVSAIAGNPPPWQSHPSGTPPAAPNSFFQQWVTPDVWSPPLPTGAETPMTSTPEEQAPLADLEVNPGQQPYAPDDVVIDAAEPMVEESPIDHFGGKARPSYNDQYSTGGGVTGEGLIGDGPGISSEDVIQRDSGTVPYDDDSDEFPVGDLADRHGSGCDERSVPGPISRPRAVIFTMRGAS